MIRPRVSALGRPLLVSGIPGPVISRAVERCLFLVVANPCPPCSAWGDAGRTPRVLAGTRPDGATCIAALQYPMSEALNGVEYDPNPRRYNKSVAVYENTRASGGGSAAGRAAAGLRQPEHGLDVDQRDAGLPAPPLLQSVSLPSGMLETIDIVTQSMSIS